MKAKRTRLPRVWVVDDALEMAETIVDGLIDAGFDAMAIRSSAEARGRLAGESFDALVTDLAMPEVDGLELLAASRAADPERPVIVMTGFGAIDSAVESIRRGAAHYVQKPFKMSELALLLQRSIEQVAIRHESLARAYAVRRQRVSDRIVGGTGGMKTIVDTIARIADADVPVLLLGETGTGKGLLARTLHDESTRARRPFVTVNCAALPDALLESQLFGHVKGAFTGATATHDGLFVEAHGGTLFLDEIGDLALPLQAKLLHVIERGVVRPVGASIERPIDVRIVAATHRDLRAAASMGTFREDLLYRLDVVSLEVPALRHRPGDLPALIEHALGRALARHPTALARTLSSATLAVLLQHRWPGNVRELESTIERAVVLSRDGSIGVDALPDAVRAAKPVTDATVFVDAVSLRTLERRYAAWAFARLDGHQGRTADKLDINRRTLARLLADDDRDPAAGVVQGR